MGTVQAGKKIRVFKRISEVFDTANQELHDSFNHHPDLVGVPSGLRDLDSIVGGFLPGSLILVAGRPKSGKTALLTTISSRLALREGQGVAFFTLELSAGLLMRRMLCAEARVDTQRLDTGNLSERDYQRLNDIMERFRHADLWVDDSPAISTAELMERAYALANEVQLGMIVVDYLQLLPGNDSQSRHEEVAGFARTLKELARELNVPVIAASQVRQEVENRINKRPGLGDLRESGALAEVADLVVSIYRDEMHDPLSEAQGIAELNVVKNRNGVEGRARMQFHGGHVRFNDLAKL